MARVFCTDLAIERGEPLEGWGGGADRYFFVKWPRNKWRSPRYDTTDLGTEFPAAMREWIGNGRHIGFVDGGVGGEMQVFTFPDNLTRRVENLAELTAILVAWGQGAPIDGDPIGHRVVICCTDAKTDACCAKYGFSAYKALLAAADPSRHIVFQCTHIGGCHLAPSIMVMDTRDRYGRMLPAEAGEFFAALDRGEYYLPRFKGRTDLDGLSQAIEIAAMRWAKERGLPQHDFLLEGSVLDIPEADNWSATVRTRTMEMRFTAERRTFEIHGHCDAIAEGPGEFEPLWVCTSVLPAAKAASATLP